VAWRQGEHVSIIGDTGSGKTYLESHLLQHRGAVIVVRTKPDDINFDGFERIRSIREVRAGQYKYLLEPRYDRQSREISRAVEHVWQAGNWCIAIDELYYLTDRLRMREPIDRLLTQGRSKRISVVCGMQRPVSITRFAISQATHVFTFAVEGRDVKTVSEATTPRIEEMIPTLKRFQYVYYNRKTRSLQVAKAQQLEEVLS
jgi:DNA helicase HerA-like ATPase